MKPQHPVGVRLSCRQAGAQLSCRWVCV